MKNMASKQESTEKDIMLPEYSFKSGVRGKHANAYRKGHKVGIRQEDGTALVRHYTLEDGAVMLAPDVRKYFPDSESVNKALRSLIEIAPKKRRTSPKTV
jgi:hypothetical protein